MVKPPNQPGHCPNCQSVCNVPVTEYAHGGCWDGAAGGGPIFAINCPICGHILHSYATGAPEPNSAITTNWYSNGARALVSGDRWRGRPGAWDPESAPRYAAKLRHLIEQGVPTEEAILILHTTTGVGALHLIRIVADVTELPTNDCKRLVTMSLSPFDDDRAR